MRHRSMTQMKQNIVRTLIVCMATLCGAGSAWGDSPTIHYSHDYEDDAVQWTTGTSARYTPLMMNDDTKYVSVSQDLRNNNGAILTSTEIQGYVPAGTNFTMSLRVKLGASNNQEATAFNIFDANNTTTVLSLAEVTTNATQWTINNNSEYKATVSAGGAKPLAELNWVHIQLTYYAGFTILTLKDAAENIIDEYDKKLIPTLTSSGGLGKMTFVTSRYYANFAIDDIVVRDITDDDLPDAIPVQYIVRYTLEDGTPIRDPEVASTFIGDEYNANSEARDFIHESQKYIYLSGNETKTAEATDNEIILVFRPAAVYNYSITNSFGDIVSSGSDFEGTSVSYPYRKYCLQGTELYSTTRQSTNPWWGKTILLDEDNKNEVITYSNPIGNVVYYAEAEDIDGAISTTGSNADIRCSGKAGAYANTQLPFVTLPAGKYQLFTSLWGNKGTTVTFFAGDTEIGAFATTGSITDQHTDYFDLSESTTLFFSGANNSHPVDYIYIVRIPGLYHYSVRAVDAYGNELNVLKEDDVIEGNSAVISYPEHAQKNGILYTVNPNATGNHYQRTIQPDVDNYVEDIVYNGTQVANVVFYTEGENISGVTVANNAERASNAQMGYTANISTFLDVTILSFGKYRIHVRGVNGNNDPRQFEFKIGDRTVYSGSIAKSTGLYLESGDIYIGEESTLSFACEGSSASGLDNMYIVRVGDFEPTPVFTQDLRASNGAIANVPKTLSVLADNAYSYTWYETSTINGDGEIVKEATTAENGGNRYTFTKNAGDADTYFYCIATGYSGVETKSAVTKITTVNETVPGAMVNGYTWDYESAVNVEWVSQNATVSIERHDGSYMLGINGENANSERTAYLPVTDVLRYRTPDHVTNDWGMEFDFYPVRMDFTPSQQAIQIYTMNAAPATNNLQDLADCFVSIVCDNTSHLYQVNIAGTVQGESFTLNPSAKYHLSIRVALSPLSRSNTEHMSIEITDARGNEVFSYEGASPFDGDMLPGGIMYVLPRRSNKTAHAYFDNITLQVLSTDLAINSDLAELYEASDDYYLEDGAGLNFDVPAATQFEWYISDVAPSKTADGSTAPRLNDDGSVTWTGHAPLFTVSTTVERNSTEITTIEGTAIGSIYNAIQPTEDNDDGKYAYALQQKYGHVQTVYDYATPGGNNVLRYFPEITASGSRWHYLRQLDTETAEQEHIDYVWCVASNALGSITSTVAQIDLYPMRPFVYVLEEYVNEDIAGDRNDLTLPGIYKFRTTSVRINAQYLVFNTTEKPVPYAQTISTIQFKDEAQNVYSTTDYPFTFDGSVWKNGDNIWNGVLSTSSFTGLDGILNSNSSVHGYYKSINLPNGVPIDFIYGSRQLLNGADYDRITQDAKRHGSVEYLIGVQSNASLLGSTAYYYDYGRYDVTELGSVSEKTTWDWSKLPERSFLTYNQAKYTTVEDRAKYLKTLGGNTYVIDPESGLAGPEMGQEYVMADFYGYSVEEVDGFPSDKVALGLEFVNDPTDHCMQGNAFIFKPAAAGTLQLTYSSTNSEKTRYLELCKRASINGADEVVTSFDSETFQGHNPHTITMTITDDMVNQYVVVRARNVDNTPNPADGSQNQYFRIYSATYTPNAETVRFTEYFVQERNMGDAEEFDVINGAQESDGYVEIVASDNAVIKYKIYEGTYLTDDQIDAYKADISTLEGPVQIYKADAYTDANGTSVGIHCRVNSTIFAWTEAENMNNSEVVSYVTHAKVYPVDIRFMLNFDANTITSQTEFNTTFWGGNNPEDIRSMSIENLKALSPANAPKAWNAPEYGTVTIDGEPYIADNFAKLYITHGTLIDIYIQPTSGYKFNGLGAPSFDTTGDTIVDMMRNGAKAKFVHYHLLHDKAKAETTAGILFLMANFTERTTPFTALLYVKEEDDDNPYAYQIPMSVSADDKIIAPIYHTAYNLAGGHSVTHWTDDYRPGDAEASYENYTPGVPKQIYQNTIIKPVMRENNYLDNYLGRTAPLEATWWFTTDHYAQNLTIANEYAGFDMPYVTPVKRHVIGTVEKDDPEDITFDLPLTITPGPTGRLNNTSIADWCTVGRGTKFTLPTCPGAVVTMEVRSPILNTESGTKFGGETPTLYQVKYKNEDGYVTTSTPDPGKVVEAYVYQSTYSGSEETLDIVVGSDYSYIRNIGLYMPVINNNRDAALITLDFSELIQYLDLESLASGNFTQKPAPMKYGEGHTGDGYEFDHMSVGKSLYRTHYSHEDGAIYYDNVSRFMVIPGQEVPDNVPYVNGNLGYTYSTAAGGTFIVGPFRSITHIRYKQGSSLLSGGGWTMTVGRKTFDDMFNYIQTNETGNINETSDTRRNYNVSDFSDVAWSDPIAGSISNSQAPEWVEMDIEEHIGTVDDINSNGYDNMQGDIWLRFEADKADVYLFAIEIYGIDPAPDQQKTLETGILAAAHDDDTQYESSLRAGKIAHFPYLLKLDDTYKPISSLEGSDDKLMQYNEGREVTLTAEPGTGYDFLKWVKPNGAGGWEDVSTQNPYKFNIAEDTQLRAVFVHRGIINYTTDRSNMGLVPEQVKTDRQGGFTVAENRGLFAGEGQTLRYWQDAFPTHEWYSGAGTGISNTFRASYNAAGISTPSAVAQSRAMEGGVVDVQPQFSANTLELLDVVGRNGAVARWLFGRKNGAPTMEGAGTTPRIVTQAVINGKQDVTNPETGAIETIDVQDVIDVSMEMHASVNNAGRADAYATVGADNSFSIPATRGMILEFGAKEAIVYSIDGGESFLPYEGPFRYYGNDETLHIVLHDAADEAKAIELNYIQATYHQRAQKPVLSMQKVDVWDDNPDDGVAPTRNVQVDVQTNSNPNAVRFYTIDGSDPQYEATSTGVIAKPGTSTRVVRGNYITINENQIQTGTQLKVLSVVPDRPDSKISTLDLEPYDSDLKLVTYVYDSRIISIHNDQLFQKLLRDHEGHFNLLSYDLNPNAAAIPTLITEHSTVFITSDAVRDNAMDALTNPTNPSSQGQKFTTKPLIIGTPLTVYWNEGYDNDGNINGEINNNVTQPGWHGMTWQNGNPTANPATPTSPATTTYTEILRAMKNSTPTGQASGTYWDFYDDEIKAIGGHYVLAFYDHMLLDGDKLCISDNTSLAPEYLSANGTQLVFNAAELLTRPKGDGTFANVSTYVSTLNTLMAPTPNPQLIDIRMTYTQDVIDKDNPGDAVLIPLDAPMLSALSDGVTIMSSQYLASSYPQFYANVVDNLGAVEVTNVEVAKPDDDLATAEKLGAQGVKDLATILTLTHPGHEAIDDAHPADPGDPNFKREYRVEYHVATEDLIFHKEGDKWICEGTDLCTIEETTVDGKPYFRMVGPQNYGIKNVSFNGYAIAPDDHFIDGVIKTDLNPDGTPAYSIWGKGEKFNDGDTYASPTAYAVTGTFIPEYPQSEYDNAPDKSNFNGLPEGQWMVSEFPWGFKDCYRMAFSLLNITEYVGDIRVTYYRRQAESPKLLSATVQYKDHIKNEDYSDPLVDNMEIRQPNGEFVLEFNSVMHAVREPGTYDGATGQEIVVWTAHVIKSDVYADALAYAKDPAHSANPWAQIDAVDVHGRPGRMELSAEGGSYELRFQFWNLEPGNYYLHIPFHIMRGAVGTGIPYHLPEDLNEPGFNGPEASMSWTDYPDVPYFDIPFTIKAPEYTHNVFNYIVSNDDWWDAFKEDGCGSLPAYATWDGNFTQGINEIQGLQSGHDYHYMLVQKKLDENGAPVAYTYGTDGLMLLSGKNFSIVGEDRDSTIITAEPEAYTDSDYRGLREDVSESNQTATLHLDAQNVYMQDLTIQNTQQGLNQDGQEYPALFDHGERNVLYNVNIDGYEESFAIFGTLSYLKNCRVSGFGDFIVGSGDAMLDSCEIVLRNRELINLCAPSTRATNKWGFVFSDCDIIREPGATKVLDHNWTLARPWDGYDTEVLKAPAVTFINTTFDVLPTNSGYGALSTGLKLRFHEYNSKQTSGEEISLSTRSISNCSPLPESDAPVLTPQQAEDYSVKHIFGKENGGYDPQALTRQAKAPFLTNDGMVLHWRANPADLCYLVYYLGDGVDPDWQHAQLFCCVPGTNDEEAYCYLTNHDLSPIFRTGGTSQPISFSEMWYGRRKSNAEGADYDGDYIDGMGKGSPTRLWFAVRAANQMGGLSPMSNPLKYQAARQYRTTITSGGVKQGDETGNAYSTIYLDFRARAPQGVKVYALTDVTAIGGDGSTETTLTFERVSNSDSPTHQDVVYANQGYLIYGSYTDDRDSSQTTKDHTFIETTADQDVEHTSYLSGTVGIFTNNVSETGLGETNEERLDGDGWSVSPNDYDNESATNISAYTLQKYDNRLGFYSFTGSRFRHHRAYLDTETAAEVLATHGISQQDAMQVIARGMRIQIIDEHGVATDITSVFRPAVNATGIYDLLGRRIPSTHHLIPGTIYIIDGKKVLW